MTDVQQLVVEAMRRHSLGGVAVAIVQKGKRPEIICVGPADRTAGRPITPATVFRIASISKTMTAVGLLQLRDEGLFGLDDPVNNYLKGLVVTAPPGGTDVTFRHLLTHTSGIGEMPRVADLVRREVWGLGKPGAAAAEVRSVYGGTLRPDVVAGSKWAYANHAFVVLGQLVEDISGRPFSEYMQERVFSPLKMSSTEYLRTDRTADQVATGHHWVLGRFRGVKDYDLTLQGAGSVLSSVTDMATYAAWLAAGGTGRRGTVLKASTLAEMMTPQYSIDPRLPGMGLAFFLSQYGEHEVAGHDGNIPGFASAVLAAPDDGIGVVVLTNTATLFGAHRLASTLMRSLLGVSDPVEALPRSDLEIQPQLWSDLAGCYAPRPGFLTNLRFWQMLGGEVQIVVQKRHLALHALSPFRPIRQGVALHRMDESDPLRFAFELDGLVVPVAFDKDASGLVERMVIGRPVNAILYPRPALRSSRLRLRLAAAGALAIGFRRVRRRRKTT